MGKKYLETKKDSLESSILGVWKTAIEEGDARDAAVMDGRTKSYKSHRAKLEAARQRREEKKVNKEEVEFMAITPDQIEEAFILLDEQQIVLGEGTFTEEQIEIIDALQEMTEEEHDELLDQMDGDQLEMYEGILGAIGRGIKKGAKRFGTRQGRASAKLKKAQKKQTLAKTKADTVAAKADTKATKKATKKAAAAAGIGIRGKAKKAARAVGSGIRKGAAKAVAGVKKSAEEVELDEKPEEVELVADYDEEIDPRKLPDMREALMQVRIEKHDTHVDPKDREELDVDVKDSAKKMKRSKEPAPNISEASGDKEAYKKFFDAALKKFKVSSPADFKSDEENEKRTKTETGKKPATIDLKPKLDDK